MSSTEEVVSQLLHNNAVVCFSYTYCPFSQKAKRAMEQYGKLNKYTIVELDKRDDGADLKKHLGKLTGASSMPRVFVGGKFVGGGDATAAKAASGELEKLLITAGAISPVKPFLTATKTKRNNTLDADYLLF